MLTGDTAKFAGLLFGIAFSTLLITQQMTIFANLLLRGASAVNDVPAADIWVMDPASRTVDISWPMPSTALDKVRGVPGVDWALPLLRANGVVRTPGGDLEPVAVVGVDDATLIGLPRVTVAGPGDALARPDSVVIDAVGSRRLFAAGEQVVGTRLELNDKRAVVRGIVDANPSFTSTVTLYTRYSLALSYVPGTRNRLSFIIARAAPGEDNGLVARRIAAATGLKAYTRQEFAREGIDFIVENTGIPINFGITVALGFVVGVAIVGLTFSLFIRDNIRQFGALKAIGVTNGRIRGMVMAQAAFVALIGYGLGVLGATAAIYFPARNSDTFKGFFVLWQIPLGTAVAVAIIIALTGFLALRTVLRTDPAEVFR